MRNDFDAPVPMASGRVSDYLPTRPSVIRVGSQVQIIGNKVTTGQWAVTGGISYTDDHDAAFTVGTNFRF